MVQPIPDMPPGTLGYRISGRLTHDDYRDVLASPLYDAVGAGRKLRVLYAMGPDLHMSAGAWWEDLKLEPELGIKHRDAWERIAVVTDVDWLWNSFKFFHWMVPGEMSLFHEQDMDRAKAWLAG